MVYTIKFKMPVVFLTLIVDSAFCKLANSVCQAADFIAYYSLKMNE